VTVLALAAAAVLAVGAALRWFDRSEFVAPLGWKSQSPMATPRLNHSATRLPDGRVLVVGGSDGSTVLDSAELYDVATGAWAPTGSMTTPRQGHTATLLPDGRVLVIGRGSPGTGIIAEAWDPATGTWSVVAQAPFRLFTAAVFLPDGRFLVTDSQPRPNPGDTAIFDPSTGEWADTQPVAPDRYNHALVMTSAGTAIMVGGDRPPDVGERIVERFDPSTDTWSEIGRLRDGAHSHEVTLLLDGRLLVIGGSSSSQAAELFDTATGRTQVIAGEPPKWAAGQWGSPIGQQLPDGRVLFTSLEGAGSFDPASGSWSEVGPMPEPRDGATMTLLGPQAVLVIGGAMNVSPYEASAAVDLLGLAD
jgi:WD40 repeat protein